MKSQIFTKDIELSEDIRGILDKKLLSKIEKYLKKYKKDEVIVRISLSKGSRWGFKVKLELNLPGQKPFFAEQKHKELIYAVTSLADEVTRRLRKRKEKREN